MNERTYRRRIQKLKALIEEMQWVQPTYNGSPSCAGCGAQQHLGCAKDCPAALVTGDFGTENISEHSIAGSWPAVDRGWGNTIYGEP